MSTSVPGLPGRPRGPVTVEPSPDGPLLVRGADAVTGPDGQPVPTSRSVVAVCTCGKSQRLPWCDDTHRLLPRSGRGHSGTT